MNTNVLYRKTVLITTIFLLLINLYRFCDFFHEKRLLYYRANMCSTSKDFLSEEDAVAIRLPLACIKAQKIIYLF